MEENKKTDHVGNIIVFILIGFLTYAGFLSYKSIDWDVLKRLESNPLVLPTPIPATQSAQITTPTATASPTVKK